MHSVFPSVSDYSDFTEKCWNVSFYILGKKNYKWVLKLSSVSGTSIYFFEVAALCSSKGREVLITLGKKLRKPFEFQHRIFGHIFTRFWRNNFILATKYFLNSNAQTTQAIIAKERVEKSEVCSAHQDCQHLIFCPAFLKTAPNWFLSDHSISLYLTLQTISNVFVSLNGHAQNWTPNLSVLGFTVLFYPSFLIALS